MKSGFVSLIGRPNAGRVLREVLERDRKKQRLR